MIEGQGPNVVRGVTGDAGEDKGHEFLDAVLLSPAILGKNRKQGLCATSSAAASDLSDLGRFQRVTEGNRERNRTPCRVIESGVVGVPHGRLRRRRHGRGGLQNRGAKSARIRMKALDGRMAKVKMPKRVFIVDELPRKTRWARCRRISCGIVFGYLADVGPSSITIGDDDEPLRHVNPEAPRPVLRLTNGLNLVGCSERADVGRSP